MKSYIAQIPKKRLLFFGKIFGNLLYYLALPQRHIVRRNLQFCHMESTTNRTADGLDFTAYGGKRQGHEVPQSLRVKPGAMHPVWKTQSSPKKNQRLAKRIFQHFGITILELLQMTCFSKKKLISTLQVENKEIFIEALARQRGVVLVSAHLGNYEMAWQYVPCYFDRQMVGVAKKMRNVRLDRFIHQMRTRFGNRILYKKGALPEMMQTLRQGEIVGILMDISRRFDGVEVNFMGRRATATPAAALLAIRCRSPIIPAFCHRNENGTLTVRIEPPIEIQRTKDLRVDLQTNTQLITDRVERAVRNYPEQWNWMLKRWKEFYPTLYPESERRLRQIRKKEQKKGR